MAMIQCRECNSRVSSRAEKCPNCGIAEPGKTFAGSAVKFVLLVAIGVVGFVFINNGVKELFATISSPHAQVKKSGKSKSSLE